MSRMDLFMHENPFATAVLSVAVVILGFASFGYLARFLWPMERKFTEKLTGALELVNSTIADLRDELREEIERNREAAEDREGKHAVEIALLRQAIQSVSENLQRNFDSNKEIEGRFSRLFDEQGQIKARVDSVEGRMSRIETRHDLEDTARARKLVE